MLGLFGDLFLVFYGMFVLLPLEIFSWILYVLLASMAI